MIRCHLFNLFVDLPVVRVSMKSFSFGMTYSFHISIALVICVWKHNLVFLKVNYYMIDKNILVNYCDSKTLQAYFKGLIIRHIAKLLVKGGCLYLSFPATIFLLWWCQCSLLTCCGLEGKVVSKFVHIVLSSRHTDSNAALTSSMYISDNSFSFLKGNNQFLWRILWCIFIKL